VARHPWCKRLSIGDYKWLDYARLITTYRARYHKHLIDISDLKSGKTDSLVNQTLFPCRRLSLAAVLYDTRILSRTRMGHPMCVGWFNLLSHTRMGVLYAYGIEIANLQAT